MNSCPGTKFVVYSAGVDEVFVETTEGGWLDVVEFEFPAYDGVDCEMC